MMNPETAIPSYDLYKGDTLSLPFKFVPLDRSDGNYNASQPHRHNYYEIFYLVQGGGSHDIDFRSYPVRDHSIHFVLPGQVHQLKRNPDSHGSVLLFTEEFYTLSHVGRDLLSAIPFLRPGSPNALLHPSDDDQVPLLGMIRLMEEEYASNRPHREDMLRSYVSVFLVHARRLFEESYPSAGVERSEGELVARLRSAIEKNFTLWHSASAYADLLCVSQNHLNSTVRKLLGKTISDLVHERIILEAKRMLYHTELSVREIGYHLNYEDPSYFTRFFRKHVGLAPNEFRDRMHGKSH